MLNEANKELRAQNSALTEQNRQLSVALFANNTDAQRAYTAMQKQVKFSPIQTELETN